jgi:hypothetical protein
MISPRGGAEVLSLEALLRWESGTEELEVSVGFQTRGEEQLAWVMPLPSAPEVTRAKGDLISVAREITQPPEDDETDGEGAAPPLVGGGRGVDVISRERVGGLRFVTLGGKDSGELTRWMSRHGFAFHDRQKPVLQDYLDKGWVVVAARFASPSIATLEPVRFRFATPEPVYPLAITGAGHEKEDIDISLFVLSPFRPTSTTYDEHVRVDESGILGPKRGRLELRYSAPLGEQAERLLATPSTWLTRYEANIAVQGLTEDLVFARANDQTSVDYSDLEGGSAILSLAMWILIPLALFILAVWISLGMARRRRASEAPKIPTQGPTA